MERLSFSALVQEVLHFFTHIEKGFLLTTKSFLIRPGASSVEFLQGKRRKFQKPISYFLIWTGLYILAHNFLIHHFGYHLVIDKPAAADFQEKGNLILRTHFTVFIVPSIICSATILYYLLAKPRFNFVEVLTLCFYGGGTYLMMLFVSDILIGAIFRYNIISLNVFLWQTTLSALYNFWVSYDFFKRASIRFLWLRLVLASLFISFAGLMILLYLPQWWVKLVG